jgi:SAM-dependent methyltransferase
MNHQEVHLASYKQQELHLSSFQCMTREELLEYEKTCDAWRHLRMMNPFQPFVNDTWSWLTVGDTNGWDAARIAAMGASDVTASDLSNIRLEHSKNEGIIQKYRVENAESMTASTGGFDVVFCKEAFHHLPRPWMGLYEMLRVAGKVVLLIEPRDWIIDKGPVVASGPKGVVRSLLQWMGMRLGRRPKPLGIPAMFQLGDTPHYEEVGNYMFPLSSRELEKVALGMDLPAVGFFSLNDHFQEDGYKFRAEEEDPEFVRIRRLLDAADSISKGGMGSTSLLLAAIFIEMPEPDLRKKLTDSGWYIKTLTRNPYLHRAQNEFREGDPT